MEFGSLAPDAPGLDLLALMIGSEGMLAVATEIVVRLIPRPQAARLIMASFDDVETAGDAVAAIISAGIIPAGLEMMDRQATRMVEPFAKAGYDLDAPPAILLCESDGTPDEVDHEIARMEDVLSASGATRLVVAKDESERRSTGPVARTPSRRRDACRPTTTAWTAPSPRSGWARCSRRSRTWRSSTACAVPTSSTRATATCIRWCCSTPTTPTS